MVRCRPLILASVVAVAVFSLLAAGCGGGAALLGSRASPDFDPATTTTSGAVAYSACMRSHGVPNFPDPDSQGNFPSIDQLGVSSKPGHQPHRLQASAPERRQRVAGNGPAAAHPDRGRAVVRYLHARPWRGSLPRPDRAGSADGRDGPGPGHRCAHTGRSAGRAGVPAGLARRADTREGRSGAQPCGRLTRPTALGISGGTPGRGGGPAGR